MIPSSRYPCWALLYRVGVLAIFCYILFSLWSVPQCQNAENIKESLSNEKTSPTTWSARLYSERRKHISACKQEQEGKFSRWPAALSKFGRSAKLYFTTSISKEVYSVPINSVSYVAYLDFVSGEGNQYRIPPVRHLVKATRSVCQSKEGLGKL